MKQLLEKLEKISLMIGHSISYLLLVMTLVTVTVVIIRHVFQSGSIALQESITYFHAALFTLAAGYAFQKNAHVRVDIFYQGMSEKYQALVNIAGTVFLLLPFCFFTLWVAFPYVERSWAIGEKSPDAGGIPAVFLIKSLIIALVLVLLFQAAIELLRSILVLKGELHPDNNERKEGI